jgi:hypothetical protein
MSYFNYNKPAEQILRDLIFATNGFLVPPQGILFGNPIAQTPLTGDRYQRDTVITIEADPAMPWQQLTGTQTLLYKRVNLADFLPAANASGGTVVPIPITAYPTDIWTLLPLINAYYGLQLTQADVLNTPIPAPVWPITMTANPASPAFSGSVVLNIAGVTPPPPPTSDGTSGDGTSGGGTGGTGGDGTAPPPQGDPYNIDGQTGVFF